MVMMVLPANGAPQVVLTRIRPTYPLAFLASPDSQCEGEGDERPPHKNSLPVYEGRASSPELPGKEGYCFKKEGPHENDWGSDVCKQSESLKLSL